MKYYIQLLSKDKGRIIADKWFDYAFESNKERAIKEAIKSKDKTGKHARVKTWTGRNIFEV